MIARYYEYNHPDPMIEMLLSGINALKFRRYASELLTQMLQTSDFNIDGSVRRAIAILKLTGLPVQEHITCIYRSDRSGIKRDWRLSDLACSLVILSQDSPTDELEECRLALLKYLGV